MRASKHAAGRGCGTDVAVAVLNKPSELLGGRRVGGRDDRLDAQSVAHILRREDTSSDQHLLLVADERRVAGPRSSRTAPSRPADRAPTRHCRVTPASMPAPSTSACTPQTTTLHQPVLPCLSKMTRSESKRIQAASPLVVGVVASRRRARGVRPALPDGLDPHLLQRVRRALQHPEIFCASAFSIRGHMTSQGLSEVFSRQAWHPTPLPRLQVDVVQQHNTRRREAELELPAAADARVAVT